MHCTNLKIGTRLPLLRIQITAKTIVMGASASRDWQPQHHDAIWARSNANLPAIIMNNYTQAGLISRYVTDWTGPDGRIGRLKFKMRKPICPGDELLFNGSITQVTKTIYRFSWLDLAVDMSVDDVAVTTAQLRLALPTAVNAASPWKCPSAQWVP